MASCHEQSHLQCIVEGSVPLTDDSLRAAIIHDFDLLRAATEKIRKALGGIAQRNLEINFVDFDNHGSLENQLQSAFSTFDRSRKVLLEVCLGSLFPEITISGAFGTIEKRSCKFVIREEFVVNPNALYDDEVRAKAAKSLGCNVKYIVGQRTNASDLLIQVAEFNGRQYVLNISDNKISVVEKLFSSIRRWHINPTYILPCLCIAPMCVWVVVTAGVPVLYMSGILLLAVVFAQLVCPDSQKYLPTTEVWIPEKPQMVLRRKYTNRHDHNIRN